MRRRAVAPAAVLCCIALAACGGSSSPSAADPLLPATDSPAETAPSTGDASLPAPADDSYPEARGACTAVSPGQVAEILGPDVQPEGSGDKCYLRADGKTITVFVTTLKQGGYRDLAHYRATKDDSVRTQRKVDGLADAAYINLPFSSITLVAGEQLVDIGVKLSASSKDAMPGTDKPAEEKALLTLAATAADRAPIQIGRPTGSPRPAR